MNLYKIKETQQQIIYRVMIERIEKEMTAELLSFLIGKPSDYIARFECYKSKGYPVAVLKKIALTLGVEDHMVFIPAVITNKTLKGYMRKYSSESFSTYVSTVFSEDNEKTVQFMMESTENKCSMLEFQKASYAELIILVDMLYVMVRDGYLDNPKLPMHILLYMNNFLKFDVDPYCLNFLLEDCCDDTHQFKLKKLEVHGYHFFVTADPVRWG